MKQFFLVVLVLLAVTMACMGSGQPKPTEMNRSEVPPSATPTTSPVQEPTTAANPTPEVQPSPTTEAGAGPRPTPAPPEMRELTAGSGMRSPGPWLGLTTSMGLALVSQTGDEVGLISILPDWYGFNWQAAPQGGLVAMTVYNPESKVMNVWSLSNQELLYEVDLLDYNGPPMTFDTPEVADQFQRDRFASVGEMAWSHDSQTLAFVSSHWGPSPDVYSFDLATRQVIQLTSGPSHAVNLNWSPDDRYIFHAGVPFMYIGYSGAGYSDWVFYAAKPDGTEVITVGNGMKERGDEKLLGWAADDQAVMASGFWWCGYYDLRTVNIENGKKVTIWADQFDTMAYDPASKKALIWVSPDALADAECGPTTEPGLYLVSISDGERVKVTSFESYIMIFDIEWVEAAYSFVLDLNDRWALVSPDGDVQFIQEQPIFSPDGALVALVGSEGMSLQVSDLQNAVIDIQTSGSVLYPTWSPDGTRLFFFIENGDNRYDLYLALAPDYAPFLVAEGLYGKYDEPPVWILP